MTTREHNIEPAGHNVDLFDHDVELARHVRETCLRTFLEAYEEAGIQGLCGEGRLEVAVDAVRRIDLSNIYRNGIPRNGGDTPNAPRHSLPD